MHFSSFRSFPGFPAFLVLFFFGLTANAQRTREVTAAVKEVTVFLQHAQVFSYANTNLGAGQTEVAIINIPSNLDESSIQIEAKGNATLLGIRYENNFLNTNQKPKDVLQVEDSLQTFQNKVRTLTDQIEVYRREEGMIMANQNIGGQKGVDAVDLEEVADFFRKRLMAIKTNILSNDLKIKKLNVMVERYRNQLNVLNSQRALPNGRILVTVAAENATPLRLEVSYVVFNAGWQPVYDLRATDTKKPMQLFYKANVFQNTGVNWNNVNLTLTTTNPSSGATKPELQAWYLDLYNPRPENPKPDRRRVKRQTVSDVESSSAAAPDDNWGAGLTHEEKALGFSETAADYTSVTQSAISVNFKIGIPYSVPSDGKKQLVEIQQFDVPATYKYAAVPKITSEAYLLAQLSGWEEYNILPGEANIFLEGTFTGKTTLSSQSTADSLLVSLGRDKKVVITREKVKDFKSKSFLGNSRKETRAFLITVRNTKTEAITLTLEDQIPVSNNKEIEVDLEEGSGGSLDKTTGKITWQMKLKPNESKKVPLKFSVKYPKNQMVPNL